MQRNVVTHAISLAVIAAIAFGSGIVVGQGVEAREIISHLPLIGDRLDSTPDPTADLTEFWKVWNALSTNFVQTHASTTLPTTEEKIWGAIAGLAFSYGDPYTPFFPPQEAKKFAEDISGNFEGIGIEIGIKDNVLTIVAPLKGTPAERAGLKAGDQIIAINGKTTEGISTEKAISLIRGKAGTTVVLTIVRSKKSQDIKVERATIQVPEIDDGLDEKSGVYHIALYAFTATSPELFAEAFHRFTESGSKLLVLDLRGNPGGYLESAVDIASHFLPRGQVVVTEDRQGKGENDVDRSAGYNDLPSGTKIVV